MQRDAIYLVAAFFRHFQLVHRFTFFFSFLFVFPKRDIGGILSQSLFLQTRINKKKIRLATNPKGLSKHCCFTLFLF